MTTDTRSITEIIDSDYYEFSRYVIESRAIPRLSDGLKPVQRRSLWAAKKIAKDFTKVSKVAGATMSNHPHGNTSIEDAISNMAQDFAGANNVCYFEGKGQFGQRINGPGKGIASARYVSVRLSEDFKRIFDVDSDLIEMMPNYDETDQEPMSFLPLVPSVLINPCQGISVGFACNILPRNIDEVKKLQMAFLRGRKIDKKVLVPYYEGFKGTIEPGEAEGQWYCHGVFTKKQNNTVHVTELPIGINREQYISHLNKLEDSGKIKKYLDNCKDTFDFLIKLSSDMKRSDVADLLKMKTNLNENITLIGFKNEVLEKISVIEIIKQFTKWRFGYYLKRFKKMLEETDDELEFKKSLLLVITKGIFKKFPSQTRAQIIDILKGQDIRQGHVSRILQIPIYRFGKDEVAKLKMEIKELTDNKKEYNALVNSKDKRTEYYIKELKK